MKIYYDLHIHSCLSPCADDDMTPNNIINMAKLKGLNLISITDHNSTLNLNAFMNVAERESINFIPGVEIETLEEIHILLYFKDHTIIDEFQKIIEENLPRFELNERIYGKQLIVDENDNVIDSYKNLLLQPLNLDVIQLFEVSKYYNMVFIPAHINRQSYGIIGRLGDLPEELKDVRLFEVSRYKEVEYSNIIKGLNHDILFFNSSDAHRLGDINERVAFLEDDILYTIFF